MNEIEAPSPLDENKLIAERREKLRALRGQGVAFPNDFRPDAGAGDLQQDTDGVDAEALAAQARRVKIAGRLDRKSTRLNSSHPSISYAVFCLKKKKKQSPNKNPTTRNRNIN